MSVLKILPDIYSVGTVDWNVRTFHGHTYSTNRGTTYNAYLILDVKTALVDTVYGPFSFELIENIKKIIPDQDNIKRCYEYGRDFANRIKGEK